ncbi:hypothetical protein GGQ84_001770 [Desulfitispora alkaliphila]|uniref:hypothetical protein n=1 Tax=Desulfitispora alkaliphila TaxID=622674 RepID=UPI003D229FC4
MEQLYLALLICVLAFVVNLPMGLWRSSVKRYSLSWFVAIHLSIPLLYKVRIALDFNDIIIPFLIITAIFGQFVGGKINLQNELLEEG